jgi:hypothetical protein
MGIYSQTWPKKITPRPDEPQGRSIDQSVSACSPRKLLTENPTSLSRLRCRPPKNVALLNYSSDSDWGANQDILKLSSRAVISSRASRQLSAQVDWVFVCCLLAIQPLRVATCFATDIPSPLTCSYPCQLAGDGLTALILSVSHVISRRIRHEVSRDFRQERNLPVTLDHPRQARPVICQFDDSPPALRMPSVIISVK